MGNYKFNIKRYVICCAISALISMFYLFFAGLTGLRWRSAMAAPKTIQDIILILSRVTISEIAWLITFCLIGGYFLYVTKIGRNKQ